MYLDVTNLYGYSMIQNLPTGNFSFLQSEEIEDIFNKILNNKIEDLFKDCNTGYILEVDLDYPTHLHDLHIDLPFAPEHFNDKLVPNFYNKKNYKIHIVNLRLYLKHGLVLTKIHNIIKFTQKPCI